MKRLVSVLLIFFSLNQVFPNLIYQSFVTAYGEGPKGKYLVEFDVVEYSKEDTVQLARAEILEFLSGMIYGYSFVYKVENKLDHSDGYFELTPLLKITGNDKNMKLNQIQEDQFMVSIQAVYKLLNDQKNYIAGFQSSIAKLSVGEASAPFFQKWESRLDVYKDAMRNAVLNEAQNRLKARPLYIKGRLLLKENPIFRIISGEWHAKVAVHIIIKDIEYQDVY